MKIRSAVPENGCLVFCGERKKTKKKQKKTSVEHISIRLIGGCVKNGRTHDVNQKRESYSPSRHIRRLRVRGRAGNCCERPRDSVVDNSWRHRHLRCWEYISASPPWFAAVFVVTPLTTRLSISLELNDLWFLAMTYAHIRRCSLVRWCEIASFLFRSLYLPYEALHIELNTASRGFLARARLLY